MNTSNSKNEILILSDSELKSLLLPEDGVYAAEQAYKAIGEGQVTQLHFPIPMNEDRSNILNSLPTHIKSLKLAGIKFGGVYNKRQPEDNLPTIGGDVIVLTNPETGFPYAILFGVTITNMRTAGGHAVVAAKYLAKKNSKTLAIIGCGAEARTGFRSFSHTFPLELVKIFDIKQEAMSDFIEEMSETFKGKIITTQSIEEAVKGVDMVLVVTTSRKPIIMESWIEEGCFVAGMLGFCDIDPMLSKKADKWILGIHEDDSRAIIYGNPGMSPLSASPVSKNDVYADMGEIVTGKKVGRENKHERIVYTHMGSGTHDMVLCNIAYKRAIEKGIGTKVAFW